MDSKTSSYLDVQKIAENKKIMKNLSEGETILISSKVIKINHVNKRQERVLVVTPLNIYNIASPTSLLSNRIKRKIPIDKVIGLTTSRYGNQIVIHIDKQDDYRFFTPNLKSKYIEMIVMAIDMTLNKPTKLYYYDDLSLQHYTTTVVDVEKKWRKIPLCDPVIANYEKYKKIELTKPESKLIFKGNNDESVQNFEEFEIIKVLGRGAFGKVMLCQNKNNQQYYAVKSMRKEDLVDKESLERTKNERYLLEKANHPFLVNLQYAFQSKEKIFLVMKFYRGGQMFSRIRKEHRFSEKRTKFYAAQVFLAIEAIHEMGYIYRDLKPQNILFDMNGYIRVSDYGLSKRLNPGERSYSITGTPSYLSPQMIRKQGHSFPVDWWTLGILIYEMLFSIPPFYHRDHRTMFTAIAFNDLLFPELHPCTPEAKSMIQGLLYKDPKKRLGSKGSEQIRNHPWFKDMDWEALLTMKIIPDYIPEVISDEDVSNFHQNFTKEEPIDTIINTDHSILEKFQKQFEGFDYSRLNSLENGSKLPSDPSETGNRVGQTPNFKKK